MAKQQIETLNIISLLPFACSISGRIYSLNIPPWKHEDAVQGEFSMDQLMPVQMVDGFAVNLWSKQ